MKKHSRRDDSEERRYKDRDHQYRDKDRERTRDARKRSRSRSKPRQDKDKDKNRTSKFADPNNFSQLPALSNIVESKTQQEANILSSKLQQNLFGAKEEVKKLSLLQKLNPANKNLGIGLTLVPTNGGFPLGLNTSVLSLLTDASKIKRKIALPKDTNINYSTLLIGQRGNNQKQLQERTGCKIVVRSADSEFQQIEEEPHVLVLGDNEAQVAKACAQIQRIIFADEQTQNRMKIDQSKMYSQGISQGGEDEYNLSLTTPYGPPSDSAYILQVPNDCVGLVIGKEGETIKNIAKRSGAFKVQVATANAPGSKCRNIFVQGDAEAVDRVRKQLNQIVESQRKLTSGALAGSHVINMQVPHRLIGLIIGKKGQTIKNINTKTGAFVCLSKDDYIDREKKLLTITGPQDLCIIAKYQIEVLIQNGLKNLQRQGPLRPSELQMVKSIVPVCQQLAENNLAIPTENQTIKEDPTMQYFMNNTSHTTVPSHLIYKQFLGPTQTVIEQQVVIDEAPKKPRRFK